MPTKTLFIHLLLKANHDTNKWENETIARGQVVTGRKNLAKETGLSVRQVRTALLHLKETNEISTIKTTNKYTILSIVNYDSYQEKNNTIDQQVDQQPTSNRPASDQQATTNKNVKNEKNGKKPPLRSYTDDFMKFWNIYPQKTGKGKAFDVWGEIKPSSELIETIIKAVESQVLSLQWQKDDGKYIPHPATWLHQERWEDTLSVPKDGKPAEQPKVCLIDHKPATHEIKQGFLCDECFQGYKHGAPPLTAKNKPFPKDFLDKGQLEIMIGNAKRDCAVLP